MSDVISRIRGVRAAGLIGAGALLVLSVGSGCAAAHGRTFASPEEGASAFVAALRPFNVEELRAILGPDGDQIVSSGDDVADQHTAEEFVKSYERQHRIVVEHDSATLVVGENDWPMPIPLVHSGDSWWFDTEKGEGEILARRIGADELSTIEACRAVVDAQREFSALNGGGRGADPVYAQKFVSDPGQRNGLYWEANPGAPPSPLGPEVAEAVAEGYGGERPPDEEGPRPFHGYCYRLLTAQGPAAPGGARSYLVDGRMTGGFGVVAWPVEYENSGIMTFLVSHQGVVYQKDLGDQTEKLAAEMSAFDPDTSWEIVENPAESDVVGAPTPVMDSDQ